MAAEKPDEPDKGVPPSPPTGGGSARTAVHEVRKFELNKDDAFTPDPRAIDMFETDDTKFAFSPGHLAKLFNPKSFNAFYALGGLAGLEKGLRTNISTGLSHEEVLLDGSVPFEEAATKGTPLYGRHGDILPPKPEGVDVIRIPPPVEAVDPNGSFADRKRAFRDNRLPAKKSKTLLQLILETWNDKVLILLTIAALVSLALGLYETFGGDHEPGDPKVDWVEGVAIFVAVIIVVLVGSLNDWQMERQFNRLNNKKNDRRVTVIRDGKQQEISIFDVMVGDVMHLATGDLVPVDGIFIKGNGVKCDESSATGESDLLRKTPADQVFAALQRMETEKDAGEEVEKMDPFIISGSKVQEGTGTFLVTAVGVNSSYGRTAMALQTEASTTPLQEKLNRLSEWIAKIGLGAGLLLFTVLFIKFCVRLGTHPNRSSGEKGNEFMEIFIVAVTVVVVAVPEGLPLAVTLSLAYAMSRMMKDNNLVRVLKACETMGNATTVCSDKTGTLTQNKMTVVATTLGKSISFGATDAPLDGSEPEKIDIPNVQKEDFLKEVSADMRSLLIEANAHNSTAFEGTEDGKATFIGSKTEVALLTFSCEELAYDGTVDELRKSVPGDKKQQMPFDSAVKFMATAVELPSGRWRLYVKGASEILLAKCTSIISDPSNKDVTAVDLSDKDRDEIRKTIKSYASQTLRTIGLTYRDFESWPPQGAERLPEDHNLVDLKKLHENMTLAAIFGIKDPLRPTVKDAIKDFHTAGVVIRMVTGDNLVTARAIASECGIFDEKNGGIAMEGPVFRQLSEKELREKVPKLQVLARSSPEDKRILVSFLRRLGETVAVTGDGTNDAPALKLADVGFSMGIAGTEVAKEASDIILLDDNFASIVKGLMWGRAVNDSVKKFLQFQLTVNVTAVVLTFVSAVASSEQTSVLNAVQLLWVNLIMDTFAALALATDPPTRSVLNRKPERKSAPLITIGMAKMILFQAVVQLIITFTLNFGGETFFYSDETNERRLSTLVFNTFVWLQIFNEINNRRLDNKLNIFEGLTKNSFFIMINLIMIGGQVLIIFVGGEAFKVVRLDGWEWGISIGLGAVSLPAGALVRLIPNSAVMAILPPFVRNWWSDEKEPPPPGPDVDLESQPEDSEPPKSPPHRTMSTLRGGRTKRSVGFRAWMGEKKARAHERIHGSHPA